ncbi:nucleoside triphosphate pyrophosphatase [Oceanicoccus sp. KOV_DT_Chl]|uniref:Maf family protein n=1 Tax=Oceanicoccus sp. KOV_DT_Chl TaxID=1904639 RepID=UPI000C7B8679|nr:Maf family protein [Oceanicoccus sp. KOV_DT_Chl]
MDSGLTPIYLASQSPRRSELLQQIGVHFTKLDVTVDETPLDRELPEAYVSRVALAKAQSGWQLVEESGLPALPVLGADTTVIYAGEIMGKPVDREHGLMMLSKLAGNTHQVMTAISFCYQQQLVSALSVTAVTFRPITPQELQDYWDTGEPKGKAGAYAIQGLAAVFVEQIRGSYSAVVGLPLLETHQLLQKINVRK